MILQDETAARCGCGNAGSRLPFHRWPDHPNPPRASLVDTVLTCSIPDIPSKVAARKEPDYLVNNRKTTEILAIRKVQAGM